MSDWIFATLRKRSLMGMFVANFDESGKHKDHKVVALAAVCAEESALQTFNAEWRKLLRYFGIESLHLKTFMQVSRCISPRIPKARDLEERAELLKPFADCMNDFMEYGLLQSWDVAGFRSIPKEIRYHLGGTENPYLTAFAHGVMRVVEHSSKDQQVNIICDHDQEIALDCLKHFNGLRQADMSLRMKLVSMTFADDQFFPSLQAADMAAYFVRLEAMRIFHGGKFRLKPFLEYLRRERGAGKMRWETMNATKEGLAEGVAAIPQRVISDENKRRLRQIQRRNEHDSSRRFCKG